MRARVDGQRVIVCVGAGGAGKTTTSAALAMGLAAEGHRVAVITIDPARRLADALGLDELDDDPRLVDPARFADVDGGGLAIAGELWAMTLDPKRTFDELVESLAPDAPTRDEILANRIYGQLSSAVVGAQEFSAVAKLHELERSGRFDVLVLDTPPSRNALDFLDAPDRLLRFFDGRALPTLLAPNGLAARLANRGTSVVMAALKRVTGAVLLDDLAVFLRSLSGLMDGFRERATGVEALLRDPATTFLVISSPEREPVAEAIFFAAQLRERGLPFGGLVVNRVHARAAADALAADVDADALAATLGPALAQRVALAHAEEGALAARDADAVARLIDATGDRDPVLVPELDGDVHDVAGLLRVHAHLLGAQAGDPRRRLGGAAPPT